MSHVACLTACKENGIKNMFITCWGDDGNECDLYSSFPALAYFAEQGRTRNIEVDWVLLKQQFLGIFGGRLEDWIYGSKLDSVPLIINRRERFPVACLI